MSFFEDNGNRQVVCFLHRRAGKHPVGSSRFDFLLVMLSVVELFLSGGSALQLPQS